MRKIILLFLALHIGGLRADPEPIKPLTQAVYELAYYQKQAQLWEAIAQEKVMDEDAWLNYYTAALNVNLLQGYEAYWLPTIVMDIQSAIPATYVAELVTYQASDFFQRDYAALQRAHALAPERMELAYDLLRAAELAGDTEQVQYWVNRIFSSNQLGPGLLAWNHNALASVRPNGVLITYGENDTYPAWILQQVHSVRTDVEVLNLYTLLAEPNYRERIFTKLLVPNDFDRPTRASVTVQAEYLLRHILRHCARPVHLSIATPPIQREAFAGELYLTGLAFAHSEETFENMSVLRENYEEKFLTDYLRHPFYHDPTLSVVDQMNMNYIPALALLYEMYQEEGEYTRATETSDLALTLAKRTDNHDLIAPIFDEPVASSLPNAFSSNVDLRAIDKNLMQVAEKLYAAAGEVSNGEYQAFLMDLAAARRFDLLAVAEIEPTPWRSLLPEEYQNLSDAVLFAEGGNPDAANHPIVNISQAAAEAYCDWLTEVYNNSNYRRKRFQRVRFRLPTIEEWEIAARGGRNNVPYPWGGPYYQNAKGCFLANFNPAALTEVEDPKLVDLPPNDDGSYFPAPVDAYFPNDAGLYGMAGNVSEMTQVTGICKGGSWLSSAYYLQIDVDRELTAPAPDLGFRVFMEVIQE